MCILSTLRVASAYPTLSEPAMMEIVVVTCKAADSRKAVAREKLQHSNPLGKSIQEANRLRADLDPWFNGKRIISILSF